MPLFASLVCLEPVGSVVRRVEGGGTEAIGGAGGARSGGGPIAEAAGGVELGGLSVVEMLNPMRLGEFGFEAGCTWRLRLFLNCCRASTVVPC